MDRVVAVGGRRVALREFREDDLAAVEAWYGEAAKAAGIPHLLPLSRSAGEGRSAMGKAGGILVIAQVGKREPIGLVEYRVGEPATGWLTVGFIALAKAYRGWGYGSEAVGLMEEWAAREGLAERFRTEVPVENGLGLYFWLRLGYRPARSEEEFWRRGEGGDRMAMVRFVSTGR